MEATAPKPMPEESATKWQYADSDQEAVGPFSAGDVLKLWSAGIIHDRTLVRELGGTEWRPVGAIWPAPPPPGPPVAPPTSNPGDSSALKSKKAWAQPANQFGFVCLALFLALLVYHIQSTSSTSEGASSPGPEATAAAPPPADVSPGTKAAFRMRLLQISPSSASGRLNARRDQFLSTFGEPSDTQTRGQAVYWYYDCTDGKMQIALDSDRQTPKGMITGTVFDY